MTEITKAHILECYEAYKKGNICPYPQEMNATSAEMTMKWLAAICKDKRWNRSFNAMQCGVVLAKIKADFGERRVHEVALSIKRDIDLRSATYGSPLNAHRQAIKIYFIE